MKNSPQITVAVPMYNASSHLCECIESILSQTYTDFELLIVDDGSQDNSVEIVRSYADPRIRLIKRKHNYIASLNCLLDEARGKYIARMDADDVMKPNRLQIQFDYMEAHPDIDIAGSHMDYLQQPKNEKDCRITAVNVSLEDMIDGCTISHPTVMMRIDRIRAKRLYYAQEFIYAEDYNLWVDALLAGLRIVNLTCRLISYRQSETQVSARHKTEQSCNAIKVQEKIWEHLYKSPFEEEKETYQTHCHDILAPLPGNKLTIIMPFLNEREEVENTLKSIRQSAGNQVEIIVINDHSDDDFDYKKAISSYRVSYLINSSRKGVAANRDMGVTLCRTPYFLLLDAHMRFYDSFWPGRITTLLDEDDRVLLCCQSLFLGYDDNGHVVRRKECPNGFGAVSVFKKDKYWPDIEWNLQEHFSDQDIEPIAHVLGAGYAASRRYWSYLKGLKGLRKYGCDEAYISFKVWREGGRCLLVKNVVIGHIYRSNAPYKRYQAEEVSNNLLVSYLTFSQSWHCLASAVALCKDRNLYMKAMYILQANQQDIKALKDYLNTIYTRSFEEVLQIHRDCLQAQDDQQINEIQFQQVDQVVRNNPAQIPGLYEGMTGQLIWHCQYSRWKGQEADNRLVQQLWAEIRRYIKLRQVSWNFSQGLAGIGWGILYLFTRKFIDDYPIQLLHEIDSQLKEIALQRISTTDFGLGIGGILAYATLRMITGNPLWETSFTKELEVIATQIVDLYRSDLATTFYAFFFLDILRHGVTSKDYLPRISEWKTHNFLLPQKPEYWKANLYDGCIGAVIGIIDYKNQTKHTKHV